jgi:c-di-GMP-related signal transduction protein
VIELREELPITIAMDTYVVRKPMLNTRRKGVGHKPLYHSGLTKSYGGTGRTEAPLALIRNTHVSLGQQIVPHPSQAFINLTDVQSAPHALQLMADVERGDALCEKASITAVLRS